MNSTRILGDFSSAALWAGLTAFVWYALGAVPLHIAVSEQLGLSTAQTSRRTGVAILASPDAGPVSGRYWATIISASLTIFVALAATPVASLLNVLPNTYVFALAGLAIISSLQDALGEVVWRGTALWGLDRLCGCGHAICGPWDYVGVLGYYCGASAISVGGAEAGAIV